MNTAVQLRSPTCPLPHCEVLYGVPTRLEPGSRGAVGIFQPAELVAYVVTTNSRRRRLFLFRTIAAHDPTAAEVPGVHPHVALLLELKTRARIEKLRRLLSYLEKRGIAPSSMSDAFFLRVSHVLAGRLTARQAVRSLLRHENSR